MWAVCLLGRHQGGVLDVVPLPPPPWVLRDQRVFQEASGRERHTWLVKNPGLHFHSIEQILSCIPICHWTSQPLGGHWWAGKSLCPFSRTRVKDMDRGSGQAQWRHLTQAWEVRTVFHKGPGERVGTEERNRTLFTCSSFPLFCCHRGNTGLPPSALWEEWWAGKTRPSGCSLGLWGALSCSLFLPAPYHSCNGTLATPFPSPFKRPNQSRYYMETCHQGSLIKTLWWQ